VVVDANVMCAFTKSMIQKADTAYTRLIESAMTATGLAVDDKDQIVQQWLDTCGQQVFGEWLVRQLTAGLVRPVATELEKRHINKLRKDFGFPASRYEATYILVAHASDPHMLVTEDIDFHDPTAKVQGSARRAQIMAEKCGPVCRYLRRTLKISVCSAEEALVALSGLE
jgi:hypothetical protein